MADPVQQVLRDLVATYGQALLDDPRRTEALLRDLCGDRRREVFVLANALRERVPDGLLAPAHGLPANVAQARLVKRLCDDLGLAPEAARWGVETWGLALEALAVDASAVAFYSGRQGVERSSRSSPDLDSVPPSRQLTSWKASWKAGAKGLLGSSGHASTGATSDHPQSESGAALSAETLTVAGDGSARFTRIGDAIAAAEPGATVIVRPGVYAESLVIDKPLAIVAADARSGGSGSAIRPGGVVVVEAAAAHCLRLLAERAFVRGLTLRGRVGLGPRNLFAVDVHEGELVLEDCEVTSDALACVGIHGSTANPVLRRCRIVDAHGSGIFVHSGGRGTIEDCTISGHALAGVEIGRDGNPTLRRCRIHGGKRSGIYVSLGGTGTIEASAIFANAGSGVEIGWQGNPTLRRCRITQNGRSGIRIYAGGAGAVEDCDLVGNTLGPWDVEDGPVRHTGAPMDW